MDKQQSVAIVLEKRFGVKTPREVPYLLEVNTFTSEDSSENSVGIGVQLIIATDENKTIKEEYQVNQEGIVFSWGDTPVIDERSLKQKL